jgi:hypothetical protein
MTDDDQLGDLSDADLQREIKFRATKLIMALRLRNRNLQSTGDDLQVIVKATYGREYTIHISPPPV